MVNRIFVERKPAYANEARALCAEIRDFLGIAEIENVRIINRYDIEGVPADVLAAMVNAVSEVARAKGLDDGFRVIANTGEVAGQTVHHFHMHVLGGKNLGENLI